ncbi:hypothetical protein [uncultured Tenacibaculum sp.]|uniref:hypothetical protein n=1 Tax=uncultured Tenacibaculum sp. TaxID=174713 RepID=UPI00263702F1|nr:hypothetical protein [uncultured Tenacibaculum sp.]
MRTYPKNITELEKKHDLSFPINKQKLDRIYSDIILRHDIAFLLLKSRILNALKEQSSFKDEVFLDSFLDKKFNSGDRLKIYNSIKDKMPLPVKEDKNMFLYFSILLAGFLLPWIVYFIIYSKEDFFMLFSLANSKLFILLFLIGVSILASFDYFFGHFFKKEKPSINTNVLTIRAFITHTIGKNKKDIREKFEVIFKDDLKNLEENHNKIQG